MRNMRCLAELCRSWIKAAPLRGAEPGAPRAGLCLGEARPARPRRPTWQAPLIELAHRPEPRRGDRMTGNLSRAVRNTCPRLLCQVILIRTILYLTARLTNKATISPTTRTAITASALVTPWRPMSFCSTAPHSPMISASFV